MPARELQAKDVKLIQYLNEAYGKEKQLETALTAHIQMTKRAPYKKRLQQHLRETREHARQVSRRIRALGGKPETIEVPGPEAVTGAAQAVQSVAKRAAAAAQGPLHLLRGTGEQEKLLKNAKTEFQDEAEEIATYYGIETLASLVGDKETAKVARAIRREEERMRDFLAKLIPQLIKAVAQEEIPAAERRGGGTGRGRSTSRRSTSRRGASTSRSRASAGTRRGSSSRSKAGSGTRRSSSGRSASSRSASSRSGSSRSSSARAKPSRSGSSRSTSSRAKPSRSGSSRSTSARAKSSRSGSSRSGSSRSGSSRSGSSRSGSSRSSGSRARSSRSGGSKR